MRIDLHEAPGLSELDADVCVIGGGAAGITLTRRLAARGHRVCLLEAGGLDYEAEVQDLYAGVNAGHPYYDLVDARLRFFGGTTNIWGGRCTPLDPIDLEARPWVPHSGWPLDYSELLPYYQAAHGDLELGDYLYDERLWPQLRLQPPALDPNRLISRFWRFDQVRERFSAARCHDLFEHPTVTVVLHASVAHLQANAHATALDHARVATLDGRDLPVRARHYVLACGGIENARLLLAADDVEPAGIGNGRDLVGRFFMEHQHGRAAQIHTDQPQRLWNLFRKRPLGSDQPPVAPTLLAAPALQRQAGILNTAFTFKLQRDPKRGLALEDRVYRTLKHQLPPDRTRRRLWHTYRDVRGWLQRRVRPGIEAVRSRTVARHLTVIVRGEQAPNPDSRVTLGSERDALGMRRPVLHWRLGEQDKRTVAAMADTLGTELARLGLGRLERAAWLDQPGADWPVDPTVGRHPIAGYHHIGTTRMSREPATGVVDPDGRVHGYGNLYVAGSSVFPTGGWANPTLTILALALRQADTLDKRLR
jgi:choline dehydrogenase-like flavoprotein